MEGDWICNTCTMKNVFLLTTCPTCLTPRPVVKSKTKKVNTSNSNTSKKMEKPRRKPPRHTPLGTFL